MRARVDTGAHILAVQTDSITWEGPAPDGPGGDGLGEWAYKSGTDAILLPSGAYHVGGGSAVMDRVSGLPLEFLEHVKWDRIRTAWRSYGMIAELATQAELSWHMVAFPFFAGVGTATQVKGAGRYRMWLRSSWDLIGAPSELMTVHWIKGTRNFRFRPAALPDDARIRSYVPRAGVVARRVHQHKDRVEHVIRANDQPIN
jgi:hypothetical protein